MFDIRDLFARGAPARELPPGGPGPSKALLPAPGVGLEVEYQGLIATQLGRLGIDQGCTDIAARRVGHGPHGFDIFMGTVRLHRWERTSALRLLLGLPLIESRIRKVVRGTWLADYSHFGGLWIHASEQLHDDPGMDELRELLAILTPSPDPQPACQGATGHPVPARSPIAAEANPCSHSPTPG